MGITELFSDPAAFLTELIYRLPAVIIALSFHEWAHAYAAYRLGDPTARNLGRMTIDPLKHLDPIGFICMILFRFGWAKPVPVNPRNFKNIFRDDIIVSLAGVSVNFVLANVGLILFYILFQFIGLTNYALYMFFNTFCVLNVSLMIFNLLPIPPLDGYHVFKDLLLKVFKRPQFFWNYERYGNMILMILVFTGALGNVLGTLVYGIINGLDSFYSAIFSLFA